MATNTSSLAEYLNTHNSAKDITLINDILTDWVGRCIWLNSGGKSYLTQYSQPKYMIKGIDTDNSKLIVCPITSEITGVKHDYSGTWNTFKYNIEKKQKTSFGIQLLQ